MPAGRGDAIDWEQDVPQSGEASLLLADLQHRVANEVACAVAAMRLARSAGIDGPRVDLFDRAIARIEGFGKVHGVLAASASRSVDIGASLHRLCRGLVAGRGGLEDTVLHISVTAPRLPGGVAHRLLLIASELVFNGIRHALAGRSGRLDIDVFLIDDCVRLVVADNGPGIRGAAGTSGTGLGSGIVDQLVRMGDGRLECDTDKSGTIFRVTLPLDGRSPVDWVVPEPVA